MPPRIRLVTIAICIFIVLYVFELVRRRHLNEEYSMGWLIAGILMLVMSIWITFLAKITALVGATTITSTLFSLGLLFLVIICLHFSIRISNLTNQVRKLSQQLAILSHEVGLAEKETRPIENELESRKIPDEANEIAKPVKERMLVGK